MPQPPLAALPAGASGDEIAIAVVGAHLSGMVLNGELKALGGRLLEATTTAPDYKLYALDTTPPKPGMLRVQPERDRRSSSKSGRCPRQPSANSSPRSRRRCRSAPSVSADGRGVKGFIVEPAAIDGARDISVRRLARLRAAG